MAIQVVRSLPDESWRCFVDEHPDGNIFHTPEMFEVFSHAKGHQPALWAAADDNGRVLALLLPVQITLVGGLLLRNLTSRAVVYGGVLCAPGADGRKGLAMLLHAYRSQGKPRSLFTEIRNLSEMNDIQPILHRSNFIHEGHLNFLIDLQRSSEEIWSSVQGNVRTGVRKARRKGVTIEEVTSLDGIRVVYAILAEVYERIHIPLAHPSLFKAAFEILYPRDMVKFWVARLENTPIGVAIRLLHKDVIYAWYAGSLRQHASCRANDLLNWHVLEWGAQNGFGVFDFGGAGKPDEDYGPRKFKAKFGGELVNYGRNTCVHSPHLLRLCEWGYHSARRFLPLMTGDRIG